MWGKLLNPHRLSIIVVLLLSFRPDLRLLCELSKVLEAFVCPPGELQAAPLYMLIIFLFVYQSTLGEYL